MTPLAKYAAKMGFIIHLGDAGLGAILCGVKERRGPYSKNWTWKPENVTCPRCLKKYRRRLKKYQQERI